MASYFLSKLSKSENARDLKFKTMVLPLFHSSVVLYFVWLDYHALTAVYTLLCRHRVILQSLYVLGLQYFTLWGQFLQQLYFVSCVLKDVLLYTPDKKLPRTKRCLNYLRGALFPSVVFPISVVMSINFWCFYNIDPTLWEDLGAFRDVIPLWLNHALHTNIVVLCVLEVALNPQLRYPDRKTGLLVPATIILLYATT
uniref:Androgen-dependent TFPI-regulating protein n=2 Tax=Timema TaxID=61471 RepID=A0A7R9HR26_9NEOP|nr:unnamed protein product [Timema cristinae]CAD7429449.1 unnamed protein product [Timema monikensis]